MKHLDKIAYAATLLMIAAPAIAGDVRQTPVPIAGAGLAAIALVGIGYRALKSRINR